MRKIKLAYVIDDDEILVTLVKIHMQKNEAYEKIETFCNGEDALTHLSKIMETGEEQPDLIILDLNMPIMDGWQFLEEYTLNGMPREIPVFIATSSIDPKDIEKARTYPIVKDYIMKPIDQAKLNRIVSLLSDDNQASF